MLQKPISAGADPLASWAVSSPGSTRLAGSRLRVNTWYNDSSAIEPMARGAYHKQSNDLRQVRYLNRRARRFGASETHEAAGQERLTRRDIQIMDGPCSVIGFG